jgi:hypothetical protein
MPARAAITTRVRTKVAKSEPMFVTPTLAKIAVSAANAADNKAQNCQRENRVAFIDKLQFFPAVLTGR